MKLDTLHALIDSAQIDNPDVDFDFQVIDATGKPVVLSAVYVNERTGKFSVEVKNG